MGGYPLHGTGTGRFTRPDGAATNGAAAMFEVGQKVGLHFGAGGERGGWV